MNDITVFTHNTFGEVRIILIDEEPWFVGKDIAHVLGYRDTSDALKRHVSKGDKLTRCFADSGQQRNMYVINESGLYALIFGSRLPAAHDFKHWVTSEVLPSIRKHGLYATDELLDNPDLLIKLATALKDEREKIKRLQEDVQRLEPDALIGKAVTASTQAILIGDFASILKQRGFNMGQNRLFSWLRENGYLIKSGERRNHPTQKAMNMELFEIEEKPYFNVYGARRIDIRTKITGKGQAYFIKKFFEQGVA